MKKLMNREQRVCDVLNQAAAECCLLPFEFSSSTICLSQTSTVLAGWVPIGTHKLQVDACLPVKLVNMPKALPWDGVVHVIVDGDEASILRVPLTQIIDTIQTIKNQLLPRQQCEGEKDD